MKGAVFKHVIRYRFTVVLLLLASEVPPLSVDAIKRPSTITKPWSCMLLWQVHSNIILPKHCLSVAHLGHSGKTPRSARHHAEDLTELKPAKSMFPFRKLSNSKPGAHGFFAHLATALHDSDQTLPWRDCYEPLEHSSSASYLAA